ncbi:MAG TPA: hypothetical protein VGB30_08145 [bacterium]|jgi:HEAT repeat protein
MPYDLKPLYNAIMWENPESIRIAISDLHSNLNKLELREIPEAVEVIASLYYIDLGDHPDFVHVVEEAVSTIAEIGEPAVATLMWLLNESDTKANLMLARTLGRIGPSAYGALKDLYYNGTTAWQRIMALFALAKMDEAALMEIFPDVVISLDDSDRELRDTAARTIGRIVNAFKPGQLPRDIVNQAFYRLVNHLGDSSSVVRAKCVRAIGKFARNNYLQPEEVGIATEQVGALLGSNNSEPDPMFIVRKEAELALQYLGSHN